LTRGCSASQGLGQQILAAFCLSGGHGAVVDLSLDSAKESIKTINAEVKEKGLPEAKLRPYECNTADEAVVKKTWAQIEKDFGKVDVVCTNAGIVRMARVQIAKVNRHQMVPIAIRWFFDRFLYHPLTRNMLIVPLSLDWWSCS
jgi:NAD(P)-dependent dehydrogenase (short-subunit alcohol dehydrogenase family)